MAIDVTSWASPIVCMYADDSTWTDPGNGNNVTDLPQSGSYSAGWTIAGSMPYRATGLNSGPSIEYDGDPANRFHHAVTDWGAGGQSPPVSFAFVIHPDTSTDANAPMTHQGSGGSGFNEMGVRLKVDDSGTDRYELYRGTSAKGGTYTEAAQVLIAVFDTSNNGTLRKDGTVVINAASVGSSNTQRGWTVAAHSRALTSDPAMSGQIAYAACWTKDITAESDFADFETELRQIAGTITLVSAATGTLTLTGLQAAVLPIAAAAGTLSLAGVSATLDTPYTLTATAGSLSLVGRSGSVTVPDVAAAVGTLTIAGQTSSVAPGATSTGANLGTLTVAGVAAGIDAPTSLAAAVGALVLSGQTGTPSAYHPIDGALTATGTVTGVVQLRAELSGTLTGNGWAAGEIPGTAETWTTVATKIVGDTISA